RHVERPAAGVEEVLGAQPEAEPEHDQQTQRPGQLVPADPAIDPLGQRAAQLLEHPASSTHGDSIDPICRTGGTSLRLIVTPSGSAVKTPALDLGEPWFYGQIVRLRRLRQTGRDREVSHRQWAWTPLIGSSRGRTAGCSRTRSLRRARSRSRSTTRARPI